jgi:hypothetical protein
MCRRIIPGPDHLVVDITQEVEAIRRVPNRPISRNCIEIASQSNALRQGFDGVSTYPDAACGLAACKDLHEILVGLALQEIPSSVHCSGSGCNLSGIRLPIQRWPRGRGKPEEVATALLLRAVCEIRSQRPFQRAQN